jgi:hypothetical protein
MSLSCGTFGVLLHDDLPFCVTLERPWLNNIPFKSCVPGNMTYECKRISSPKFGNTFEVVMPEGSPRSHILFHKGNKMADSSGCLLIADCYDGVGVMRSTPAFMEFLDKLRDCDSFYLNIQEDY